MTSQRLQSKVLLLLSPFGRYFNTKFVCTTWYGLETSGWKLRQSKAPPPRFRNTSTHKVLLYRPPFGRNSNVNLLPSLILPGVLRSGWTKGSKMVPIEMLTHITIQLLYTLGLQLYLAPFGHRTRHGRQKDDRKTGRTEYAAYAVASVA